MIPGLCRMVISQSHAQSNKGPLRDRRRRRLGSRLGCGATAVGPTRSCLLHCSGTRLCALHTRIFTTRHEPRPSLSLAGGDHDQQNRSRWRATRSSPAARKASAARSSSAFSIPARLSRSGTATSRLAKKTATELSKRGRVAAFAVDVTQLRRRGARARRRPSRRSAASISW